MCVYIGVAPRKTYVLKELKSMNAKSMYDSKEFNGASPAEVFSMLMVLREEMSRCQHTCKAALPHCHPQLDPTCCTLMSVLEYSNKNPAMLETILSGY